MKCVLVIITSYSLQLVIPPIHISLFVTWCTIFLWSAACLVHRICVHCAFVVLAKGSLKRSKSSTSGSAGDTSRPVVPNRAHFLPSRYPVSPFPLLAGSTVIQSVLTETKTLFLFFSRVLDPRSSHLLLPSPRAHTESQSKCIVCC